MGVFQEKIGRGSAESTKTYFAAVVSVELPPYADMHIKCRTQSDWSDRSSC